MSLKHVPSATEQPCSVCGARFVALEDTGSRLFTLATPPQEPFTVLMCGGCHSKWSHGVTVAIRAARIT
jgi:hypothetical protein